MCEFKILYSFKLQFKLLSRLSGGIKHAIKYKNFNNCINHRCELKEVINQSYNTLFLYIYIYCILHDCLVCYFD